jgi:hypothetical protein
MHLPIQSYQVLLVTTDYKFYPKPLHLNKQDDLIKVTLKGDQKLEFPLTTYKALPEYILSYAAGAAFPNALKSFYEEYSNNLKFSFERIKGKYIKLHKATIGTVML